MDPNRFDRLSRAISRRTGLGLLATLGLTRLTTAQTSAKKKKKNKHKDKCKGKTRCRDGSCVSGDRCCPGMKPCGRGVCMSDHMCCLVTHRVCDAGGAQVCVPKGTCCPSPYESECPSDPSGCCNILAGEQCSTNDGCCNLLHGINVCPGDGRCCDLSTHCCTVTGCQLPDPIAGCP